MGRMIKIDTVGKVRNRLIKIVLIALRTLTTKTKPDVDAYELAATISSSLEDIFKTIDITVDAWEKRNYWVKADKFRMEWAWTGSYAKMLKDAVDAENWNQVKELAGHIAKRLGT